MTFLYEMLMLKLANTNTGNAVIVIAAFAVTKTTIGNQRMASFIIPFVLKLLHRHPH